MAEKSKFDYSYKIVILGDSGVETRGILCNYVDSDFTPKVLNSAKYDTDFIEKYIKLEGSVVRLLIWDFGNYDHYKTRWPGTRYRGANGVMFVYDVTNKKSLMNIQYWKNDFYLDGGNEVPFVLLGNNCDQEDRRQISTEIGAQYAYELEIQFFEVSWKTGINIEKAFTALVKEIMSRMETCKMYGVVQKMEDIKPLTDSTQRSYSGTSILQTFLGQIFARQEKSRNAPEGIQDPYAQELYEKALNQGKEKERSIRVNIVGNYQQGKTSLMKRLLQQSLRGVKSTNGIDIQKYECEKISSGKLIYTKKETADDDTFLRRLVLIALEESDEEKKTSNASQNPLNNEQPLATVETSVALSRYESSGMPENPTTHRQRTVIGESAGRPGNVCLVGRIDEKTSASQTNTDIQNQQKVAIFSNNQKKIFQKEITSKRVLERQNKKDETSFVFWDFGGQFVFYATHALFHSRQAIYVLVFDLSVPLSHIVIDEDFPSEQEPMTMAYYIQFWMNSIHSFVGSDDGCKPVVLLVGTHKDKIQGDEETKRRKIQRYFDDIREMFDNSKVLNHIYSRDFAVDNTTSKDPTVAELRATIMEIGEKIINTTELPAKWIQLEKSLNEKKHLRMIRVETVKAEDAKNEFPLNDLEQIKLFLQYHHAKGNYIYFDEPLLADYVILDPQFLIDAFKSIISSERFCTNNPAVRPLWKRLLLEARLEKSLVEYQWNRQQNRLFHENKNVLLEFMKKHHIISEATVYSDDGTTKSCLDWYIVPSLLREKSMQDFVEELQGRERSCLRLVMLFDKSLAVSLVYHRLIAAHVGRWPVAQIRGKPLIFQNLCIVRLNLEYIGISELKGDTIELSWIRLCSVPSSDDFELGDDFRRFSESVLKQEFRKLKGADEKKAVPYTVCFRCNHTSHRLAGSVKLIEKHELGGNKLLPCPDLERHDIDVESAKAEWYSDIKSPSVGMKCVVSERVISKISQCIGNNWQLLGLELGLTQAQIEQVTEDNRYSTEMKIFHMLRKWSLKLAHDATLEALVNTMTRCTSVTIEWDEIKNIAEQEQFAHK